MVDSGAFSVWSRNSTIDIDEYIRYCKARPDMNLYVGLDVIPPKGSKLTDELKNEVAKKGFDNYLYMIRKLPMEKVMPVFHRGDNTKWLEHMIDFGCPYIGISPRFDGARQERRFRFLSDCKKVLLDSQGKCIVKTHGFAVTNHAMMLQFPFYSVDSATWTQIAAWGGILVPHYISGKWDFTKKPFRVFCSIVGNKRQDSEHHLLAMQEQRPQFFDVVKRWLDFCSIGLGEGVVEDANGRKPVNVIERWADRAKTQIHKVSEPGVCNSDQVRRWINAMYFHRCNEALKIEHIYLAGNGPCMQVEEQIKYRLRSFVDGRKTTDWIYPFIGRVKPERFPVEERPTHSLKVPSTLALQHI